MFCIISTYFIQVINQVSGVLFLKWAPILIKKGHRNSDLSGEY